MVMVPTRNAVGNVSLPPAKKNHTQEGDVVIEGVAESVPRLIGFVFKAHAGGHTGTDCTGYNG